MKKALLYVLAVLLLLSMGMALGAFVVAPMLRARASTNVQQKPKNTPVLQTLGKFTTNLSDPKDIIQITVNLEFYDAKVLNEVKKTDPNLLVMQDVILKHLKTLTPTSFASDKSISKVQADIRDKINAYYGKTVVTNVLFGADTVITVMP
ncbi:flagellar basal body-associated protein FliL [Coprothermobacteraceae bacterium]|nr:flagellar basal body-associated protein FliL [Coprothermobacteraceae bacterium]